MNESLCRSHYAGTGSIQLFYHRVRGFQRLDLIESHAENKTCAYQIIENESFSGVDFELMKAFQKQNPAIKCRILAPVDESTAIGQISLEPWENLL